MPDNTDLTILAGGHLVTCGCGFRVASPSATFVADQMAAHYCPAGPLDVLVDRVVSIPGAIVATTLVIAIMFLVRVLTF